MNYQLVITTDGRPDVLDRTIGALYRRVTPQPSRMIVVDDSGDPDYQRYLEAFLSQLGVSWWLYSNRTREGFCRAVTIGWNAAVGGSYPYTFWLEDDIEIVRGINLIDVAHVLEREPKVAQMGFMRQPVNEREKAAGSLFALYRDQYQQQGVGVVAWLRSTTNFTTTCSLMRTAFMADNPWPPYTSECEGKFSLDLLTKGYAFGVWGTGSAWVNHFGQRAGRGY